MKLLTEIEVCEMIGISCSTLRKWRLRGRGPAFVKFGERPGAAVRYPQSELELFIGKHTKHAQDIDKDEDVTPYPLHTKEEVEEEQETKEQDDDEEFDYYL